MNTNLQKIGELLAQCRKNKGLTQEEVGVMIGVQKAMVSKVENGLCVNFGTVNRIAEALGVEPIVALKSKKKADKNLIDYVMTVIVEFARRHDLTIREASNYIRRFKGIDFLTEFYDVEHTLSFNDHRLPKQWRNIAMILYHGSNMAIDGIDLNRCRPYKDFGRGFYLTDIREQAQRMAARTARMFSGNPTLTMFEFDLEEAQSSELKVKVFKEPDWEWARFVMSNRDINTTQPCHDYDIVIGPVADDTIARLLRLYTENFINEEQLLHELTFSKVTSQYFFHSEAAIKMLKRL